MDPDTALAAARSAVVAHYAAPAASPSHIDDLVTAFEALDAWLSAGGFPPAAWHSAV